MAKSVMEPFVRTLLEPVTITLRSGDTEREETYSVLTLRAPKAGDLRVFDKYDGDVAGSLGLIARLADVSVNVIDALAVPDYQALSEQLKTWMGKSPETGPTS